MDMDDSCTEQRSPASSPLSSPGVPTLMPPTCAAIRPAFLSPNIHLSLRFGLVSLKSIAVISPPSLACQPPDTVGLRITMNPPPPMPDEKAFKRPMQRVVVMAASTAVPLCSRKMDRPRLEQVMSSDATAPCAAGDRYAGFRGSPVG